MKITSRCSALLFLAALLPAQAQLVNEQFTDLERSTQTPPTSLQWTVGSHNSTAANAFGTLDASSGSLVWDHTNAANSFSAIWAHFTPGGAPVTLAEGETMTLSFEVTFSGGAFEGSAGAFRWALLDSFNSRVTTDFAGNNEGGISSGSVFSAWKGYEGQTPVNTATGTNSMLTRERTGTGNGLFTGTNWTNLGVQATEPTFTAGLSAPGSLTLNRTASGVVVQASLNGVSTPVATDTVNPRTTFDSIAFFVIDGLTHNITLDNIQVTVVPEPGSALLALGGGVGLLLRRRRR